MIAVLQEKREFQLLCGVLTLAALLRYWGISFGLPGTFRPDEEYLVSRALNFHSGDLNPRLFNWPTAYFYISSAFFLVARIVADLLGALPLEDLAPYLIKNNFAPAHYLGRLLTATFGVASIAATYFLGRKILGGWGGVLSAYLLAVTFIHARDSHFFTTDIPLTFFSTIALVFFVTISEGMSSRKHYIFGAFWTGLTMATKYTALALGIPFAIAHLMRLFRKKELPWSRTPLTDVVLAAPLCFVFFLCFSPYILLDWETFQSSITVVRTFATHGSPISHQFGPAWIWGIALPNSLGLPLMGLTVAGVALCILRFRKDPRAQIALLLLVPFIVALLVVYSSTRWSPIRYLTFVTPACTILAAFPITFTLERLPKRWVMPCLLCTIFAIGTLTIPRIVTFNRLLTRTDTRVIAGSWIKLYSPQGRKLLSPTRFTYGLPQLPRPFEVKEQAETLKDPSSHDGWIVVDESPIEFSPKLSWDTYKTVQNRYSPIFTIDPRRTKTWPPYDESDAFYVPLKGVKDLKYPGPKITVRSYEMASKHRRSAGRSQTPASPTLSDARSAE